MLTAERDTFILAKIREQGMVLVNELAEDLEVSSMTIRRDLNRLADNGQVIKVHGGAVPQDSMHQDRPIRAKKLVNTTRKKAIARQALKFVKPGDIVLVDAGTTTFELAVLLENIPDLTVVTSDLNIAIELCRANINLHFIGGEVDCRLENTTGPKAEQFISDLHVNTVFLGIASITDELVLCSHSIERAALKKKMLACAKTKVLLADNCKFGRKAFSEVAPASIFDAVISDRQFTKSEREYFNKSGAELICCS